jgi:large subunit ribosomal protein L4
MYKAPYFKTDGSKGRARALPEWLFDGVVNQPVLHRAVKAYLANQRQGTAAGKNRSAVAGGSRKPWRQKGTGRARQGTIRAAQWAGGGLAFPPQPHSWREKLPRKVRALARRSAFNARAQEDRVVLIDGLSMDEPKTAVVRDYLASIGAEKRNVYLSARNLPGVEVRSFKDASTYDVLWASTVVIERDALDADAPAKGAAAEAQDVPTDEAAGDEPPAEETQDA